MLLLLLLLMLLLLLLLLLQQMLQCYTATAALVVASATEVAAAALLLLFLLLLLLLLLLLPLHINSLFIVLITFQFVFRHICTMVQCLRPEEVLHVRDGHYNHLIPTLRALWILSFRMALCWQPQIIAVILTILVPPGVIQLMSTNDGIHAALNFAFFNWISVSQN